MTDKILVCTHVPFEKYIYLNKNGVIFKNNKEIYDPFVYARHVKLKVSSRPDILNNLLHEPHIKI